MEENQGSQIADPVKPFQPAPALRALLAAVYEEAIDIPARENITCIKDVWPLS